MPFGHLAFGRTSAVGHLTPRVMLLVDAMHLSVFNPAHS